jgi:hypothetical protein
LPAFDDVIQVYNVNRLNAVLVGYFSNTDTVYERNMSAKVQSGECNRKGGGALRGPVHPKLYSHLKSVQDADVHSCSQSQSIQRLQDPLGAAGGLTLGSRRRRTALEGRE